MLSKLFKPAVSIDKAKIDRLLSRNIEDVFVKESLEKKLLSGKRLCIKLGIDPTSPNVHLGRAVPLRKLKEFQDLGHDIVLIIGDYTALIGDPSDKLSKRPMLTSEDIEKNLTRYKEQILKVLDGRRVTWRYNSEWLKKLSFKETCNLAEAFSVQQMLARRNFAERFEKNEEISLREFLYPIMQGYDSVAIKADIEIGGFDQLFNVKAGRVIQRYYHMKEQDVLTVKMLVGTDGRKMSSSWGNVISLLDTPRDMFGKIMSIRDELIKEYFLLTTDLDEEIIEKHIRLHPKEAKEILAKEIVKLYHGEKVAEAEAKFFTNTFSKDEVPEEIPEITVADGETIIDIALKAGISSKSEARRLIEQGAVSIMPSGDKITDVKAIIPGGTTLRIGKRTFVKVL